MIHGRGEAKYSAGWHAAGLARRPGRPVRQRRRQPGAHRQGFSWEYPLSVHGLMHNVITNAWRGDPYKIDTLLIFMANMAWNSSMNTTEVRKMLNDKDEDGEYKIPFLIVADAFQSETVALPTWCCRTPPTWNATTACPCWIARFPNSMARWIPCASRCCRRPVMQTFPGSRHRTGFTPQVAGFYQRRWQPQIPRLPGFCDQLRSRSRHRLPGRLARQGRREIHEGRAQSQAVGDVREEQLRIPLRTAQVLPVHA